jgi:eukaryotic-like serine/threonine-protein kinase
MDGQQFGHYRVLEKIGAGAMGEVYRARDERLGRDVALKIIRPTSSETPDRLRRFELEARAAAALNHPNILSIYDVGFEGTTPYIVTELLEGKTLRALLADCPLPIKDAIDYALQIAHGLTAAHERHIVHRDLKPENLFITNDGRVKILDFGVAKLQPATDDSRAVENMTTVTKHGAVIGTVAYMSPEQLRGKAVDHRSDIFSFGAILYEMLSGSRAFRGETEVDTMTAVLREQPPQAALDTAAIPAAYQEIVHHCLEKEPENRFQTSKDLAFALQTVSGSSPIRRGSWRSGTGASKRLPWVMVGVLALAVAVFSAVELSRKPIPSPQYSRLTFEAGTVYTARFATDSQSIIYSAAWNGKPVRLFSTVANSLLSQPLDLSDANLLGISKTNELALVVHGTHSGQLETLNGVLARAPMAGGSPREVLSDVRWADWDSSGKLAVVHYVEGHSRLEYPISTVLYQSSGWISDIRFSPQGDQIAFMDHPALWDNRGVVSVTDLAGHVRRISREWDCERGLAWRPDGKEIWFTAIEKGATLRLMAVDLSGKLRNLLELPVPIALHDIASDGRVLISIDSKRLAMGYTTLGSEHDIDLTYHDHNSARDISNDGQYVVFNDASEAVGPGYAVMWRKTDGSPPVRLGEGSAGGISPDGKWALAVSTTTANQVTLLPTGAGQPRTIKVTGLDHVQNGFARFLPDGQRFSVNGDQAGHAPRCYVVNIADGKAGAATPEGIGCGASSPDSQWMVGSSVDGAFALYPLTGGAPRTIPRVSPGFDPIQWSNDGLFLYGYHWGESPSRVYKLEISTGKESVVQELRPGAPAGVVVNAPIVATRDGKRFAYSYNQTLSVLYVVSGLR